MRDYAISCKGTQKYASLASVCEAPFCARVASLHASKYAPTPLEKKYDGLNLLAKQSLLVDFLLCLPEIMKSALDRKKVIGGGFLNAGFVDSDTKKWPDFDGMLHTARTKLTWESYDFIILLSFPKLQKEQLRKGQLSDKDNFIPNFIPDQMTNIHSLEQSLSIMTLSMNLIKDVKC